MQLLGDERGQQNQQATQRQQRQAQVAQHIKAIQQRQIAFASPWYGLARPSVTLICVWLLLLAIGVAMQFSILMYQGGGDSYVVLWKLLGFVAVALVLGAFVGYRNAMASYSGWIPLFMILTILASLLLFAPGLGREVKGGTRWLDFRFFTVQVSEGLKWVLVLFSAHYLAQRTFVIPEQPWKSLFKMLLWFGLMIGLLVLQRDLGTIVIVMTILLGLVHLARAPFWRFTSWIVIGSCVAFYALVTAEHYRKERFMVYQNPFEKRETYGFQPSAAFEAQGLGGEAGFFGVGFGKGTYKNILPESANDFIYANIGEELGLFGLLLVCGLFAVLVLTILRMGLRAYRQRAYFEAFYCYGVALWFGSQSFLHMGVNMVLLPTKGMNLPFVSAGGSSLVVSCFALAMVLRADSEVRGKMALKAQREALQRQSALAESEARA